MSDNNTNDPALKPPEEPQPEQPPGAGHDAAFADYDPSAPATDQISRQGLQPPAPKTAVEALLFVAEGPLDAGKIADVIARPRAEVRQIIEELAEEFRRDERGFRIEEIGGGWQMLTDPRCVDYIKTLFRTAETAKLTAAMLETLALVAYKQPILRADIEAVRGVQAGPVLRSLMEKGLVRIAGRADAIGKPFLYGTTRKFLEHFGLNSIEDLPKAEELHPPEA